mgnify:CR=1 FL=1
MCVNLASCGGNSSNNTSGGYYSPSDGTTPLTNAPNTWGYSLDILTANNPPTLTPPTINNIFSGKRQDN